MSYGEYLGAGSSITLLLYHLNGNSNDSSGNSRNGTDTSITYSLANGRFGQGAGFNGTSSKIVVPSTARIVGLSSFTFSVWFNTSSGAANMTIYSEGSTSTITPFLQFFIASGQAGFQNRSDASALSLQTTTETYSDGLWHLFTAVKVSSSSRLLYIDGNLRTSDSTSVGTTTVNTSNIGVLQRTTSTNFYSGALDEMIFENVAWDASKIKRYYTWTKGRFE